MKFSNHAAIVTDYFKTEANKFDKNIRAVSAGKTLSEVIKTASRSRLKNGNMYSHQYRIGKKLLKDFEGRLLKCESDIVAAKNFDELLEVIEAASRSIRGVGELTAYDIAYRISVFKKTPPEYIYLHAGVRKAVKALGLPASRKITKEELSRVFPTEELCVPHLENCLCVYKGDIAKAVQLNRH